MWRISDRYNGPTFVEDSITCITVNSLSVSLQFMTSFMSFFNCLKKTINHSTDSTGHVSS